MTSELPIFIQDEKPNDELMVLNKTDIQVTMQGLSAQTVINQYFENKEEQNIEAVYTFPIPMLPGT